MSHMPQLLIEICYNQRRINECDVKVNHLILSKKKIILILMFLLLLSVFFAVWVFFAAKNNKRNIIVDNTRAAVATFADIVIQAPVEKPKRPAPPPVSMEKVKSQGCVAGGLLNEYGPKSDNFIELINRSHCYYLHRAIETWLTPPDFSKIDENIGKITKKDVVYGMFIAEALDFRADYVNEDTGEKFNFRDMCKEGSEQTWGEGSCKPTFSSVKYRDYIKYITSKAIDLGVQSFTFGQIYMQESTKQDYAPRIVKSMREYAKEKGVDIIIGAQTGNIRDEKYLKLFDYIEGGVGIDTGGNVENGPCLSTRGSCWALLWNEEFASKANNVLLHLDWSGIPSDDLNIFARMDKNMREKTLQGLYTKFSTTKTGFMMPYSGALYEDNNGCRGPKKKFYSPDNAYSCKDEDAINKILSNRV